LETDDPLACEVKLFDGEKYGVPYLAKGVQQAMRYADDYGHTAAHLVVFNLSERPIELPTDDPDAGWPPRMTIAGMTIFLVLVQAAPRPTASKAGAAEPVKVARASLVPNV